MICCTSMGAIVVGALAVGKLTESAGRRGVAADTVAACGVLLFIGVQAMMACSPGGRTLAILLTLAGTVTGWNTPSSRKPCRRH